MQGLSGATRAPYLDGLRGVSILPVLLGHTFSHTAVPVPFSALLSAHAGVRVFFVVSGYLITALLLGERAANGKVRLGAFYGRRLAKLLPILWLYLAVLAGVSAFQDVSYSGRQLMVAALLATGFFQASWYMGHVWSLTVEEVFYVSWAPMVQRLAPRTLRRGATATVVVAVLARGFNIAVRSPRSATLLAGWPAVPVVDELDSIAIGGLLALYEVPIQGALASLSRRRGPLWFAAGTAVLIASLHLEGWEGPRLVVWGFAVLGPVAFATCIAAVLALATATHADGRASFLENRYLAGLGRASYSIYVVQQSFCVPSQWRSHAWFQQPPLNLLLAIALGVALFRFVEEPLRRRIVQRLGIGRRAFGAA